MSSFSETMMAKVVWDAGWWMGMDGGDFRGNLDGWLCVLSRIVIFGHEVMA